MVPRSIKFYDSPSAGGLKLGKKLLHLHRMRSSHHKRRRDAAGRSSFDWCLDDEAVKDRGCVKTLPFADVGW